MTLSDDIIVDSFTNKPSANCSLMCLWGCIQRKVPGPGFGWYPCLFWATFVCLNWSRARSPLLRVCLFISYQLSGTSLEGGWTHPVTNIFHFARHVLSLPSRLQKTFVAIALAKDFCCHRACKRLSLPSRFQKTLLTLYLIQAWAVVEAPGDILLDCYQGQRTTNTYLQ